MDIDFSTLATTAIRKAIDPTKMEDEQDWLEATEKLANQAEQEYPKVLLQVRGSTGRGEEESVGQWLARTEQQARIIVGCRKLNRLAGKDVDSCIDQYTSNFKVPFAERYLT